jgi:hypothetical protein
MIGEMKIEFIYNGFLIEKHRITGECEVYIDGSFRKFQSVHQTKMYIDNFLMN